MVQPWATLSTSPRTKPGHAGQVKPGNGVSHVRYIACPRNQNSNGTHTIYLSARKMPRPMPSARTGMREATPAPGGAPARALVSADRLISGQLPAHARLARRSGPLVADDATGLSGKADQGRSRSERRSCATTVTSGSRWRRPPSPEPCWSRFCASVTGCGRHLYRYDSVRPRSIQVVRLDRCVRRGPCASLERHMAAENGFRSPNQADEQDESLCTVPDQGRTPRRAPFVLSSQDRKAVIREMSDKMARAG